MIATEWRCLHNKGDGWGFGDDGVTGSSTANAVILAWVSSETISLMVLICFRIAKWLFSIPITAYSLPSNCLAELRYCA